eukprot:CAMPEP_0113237026 /NCGR_PEP_ID=MMETSP0008_2-20120614/4408_1 /TAXON_ID=97485 /ORGANISM="Prymnesium parvum" /LENGTH=81 /DNA_ID=CAMNT_0000084069 /DNA_START=421 /DNA_END=666 /DNA_ORIENTATION=+ /assembly_acc=CAM_ASM_000153
MRASDEIDRRVIGHEELEFLLSNLGLHRLLVFIGARGFGFPVVVQRVHLVNVVKKNAVRDSLALYRGPWNGAIFTLGLARE